MKRLVPFLLLILVAAAGCKSSQWTFSKDWGGGEPAPTQPKPEPARPAPVVTPQVEKTPEPEPQPVPAPAPKDVIFVLGINGMD